MKYILSIILILLSFSVQTQKTVELCAETLTEKFSVEPFNNIYWGIEPQVSMNVDNNVVYITFQDIGTYVITAKYSNGICEAEDKYIIDVIVCEETTLWVPNSFTPNNDNLNDVFKAYGLNVKSFHMTIWNRWGELVYETNNILSGWDGFYMNTLAQQDVYAARIVYQDYKGRYFEKTTTVNLIH